MPNFSLNVGSGVFNFIFGLLGRGLKIKKEEKIRREWRKLDGKIIRIYDVNGRQEGGTSGRQGPFTYEVEAFDPLTNSTRSFRSEKKRQGLAIGEPVSVYVNPQLRWSSFVDISDLPNLDAISKTLGSFGAATPTSTSTVQQPAASSGDLMSNMRVALDAMAKSAQPAPGPTATEPQPEDLNPDLANFIKTSFEQGEPTEVTRAKLVAAGWDQKDVDRAYVLIRF